MLDNKPPAVFKLFTLQSNISSQQLIGQNAERQSSDSTETRQVHLCLRPSDHRQDIHHIILSLHPSPGTSPQGRGRLGEAGGGWGRQGEVRGDRGRLGEVRGDRGRQGEVGEVLAGTGGGVEDRGMSHRCRQVIGRATASV